jgi:hypothetical protein
MREKREAEKAKQDKKGKRAATAAAKKKRAREGSSTSDSSSTSSQAVPSRDHSSDEISESELQAYDKRAKKSTTKSSNENDIVLPTMTENSRGQYYAVLYTEPRPAYYWGKVLHVFSDDVDDSAIQSAEFDFLKKQTISSDPAVWKWTAPTVKDILVVPVDCIFYGPEVPVSAKGLKECLIFPDATVSRIWEKIKRE